MLLTSEDKRHLLKVLAKDRARFWSSPKDRKKSAELYEKIEQTLRNENTNKDHN
ncbi:hypothetical protein B0H94_1064 [Salsuginibacillus halophilus]|uniref:Uncharacterized protein n=1 Tax=Salsuginibacillus halophilus TaxID=517424 RepID=A0A2P8HHT0_9BACI|nr:hypothetical protein [Salsuginibacillus halophilus]PSL45749.1 hypothetical protein B0H94_1064 [Salsuginibacillus halophilus]